MSTRIAGQKVLAIVLAGGKGSRLAPLTTERAKPAVPFLGTYRLIDFTLSNLVHSGVQDVWVVEQYLPHGLNDHLSGGRPWDLDRTRGGLVVMPPFSSPGNEDGEFAQGNAHALAQHLPLIREFGPNVVLVLSADHIYRFDYSDLIRAHVGHRASVTMATTEVELGQATRFGNVVTGEDGRVERFAYKPDEPLGGTVTAEIFAYDAQVLLDTLEELGRQGDLGDYGEELLPALVARGDAYAHPLGGYWMDVGTLSAYHGAHRDFLDGRGFPLDTEDWPFITSSIARPPTRVEGTARLDHALVCGGAVIAGEVVGSVVGPNAVVEHGAVVRDSIVQAGAVVRAGARVTRTIVDLHATVGEGAQVGAEGGDLSVIGARATVEAGARVGGGLVVEPRVTVRAGREGETARPPEGDDTAGK
ncbi:glucose-1-phosphate adenylyltransferase [Deinococcus aetherius]|uniref:Glucose-1-phosphate adenylyltransferase n=1 Tax=Deinococcus aetherius TaxID=200252 RepID=A0ABM8AFN3_9DEIO|nr:glucose-1-phosphate adenylyltransferase family protein [Deinococcus aetherius]BDP42466.1 glucose-1-phosphate adenylyltransferase [Deinococcus aetherius]